MRFRRFIHRAATVLATACFVLAVPTGPSAFDDGRFEVLQQQRLFTKPPPVIQRPVIQRTHTARQYEPRKREAPLAMPVPSPDGSPAADSVSTPPKITRYVMIFGDSIGVQLGQGLREAFAANPELVLSNKAKAETGLVNTSERDWPKFMRDTMGGAEPVDMAIMMIGANDNQPLRDDAGQALEPLSEKWREIYVRRIDDVVNAVRDKKIPLVWVGMPVMKSEKLTARMLGFNDIYRERVQRAGMTYIDIWEAFSDEASHYAPTGPDIAGQSVKIRAADGVHFTEAGARKLAFFAEGEVKKLMDVKPAQEAPQLASIPVVVSQPTAPEQSPSEQIEKKIIQAIAPALDQLKLQLPDILPLPIIPVRPLAGPVVPLNAAVLTKGAELASGPQLVVSRDAYSDVMDVLDRGRAPRPKQGRADDFAWTAR